MEDQNTTELNTANTNTALHDFERLTEGLKASVNKFQADQSPENFAGIITALSEFGISGADIWNQAATYSKRHPIRVAMFAGLVFFAMKGLMPAAEQRRLDSTRVH